MKLEQWIGAGVLGLIGAILVSASISVAGRWDGLRPRVAGDAAPSFVLPEITDGGRLGRPLSLGSLRGRVVVVDFWATWCTPCRTSMPRLESIASAFPKSDVALLSINIEGREKTAAAKAMAQELNPSAVVLSDGGRVADLYSVTTIPHLLVIDREGRIAWVHRGGLSGRTGAELAEEIERLRSR